MSSPTPPPHPEPARDMLGLVEPMLLGELDDAQLRELERWLAGDESNRVAFLREVQLCRGIGRSLIAEAGDGAMDDAWEQTELELVAPGTPSAEPDVMSEVVEQALALRRRHELEDEANRKLAAQQAEEARSRRFELRRMAGAEPVKRQVVIQPVLVWLGLAAAVGFALWLGLPGATPEESAPPDKAEITTPRNDQHTATTPAIVAMVRDSANARWVGHDDPNDYLREGQRLTLTHGHAEIVMGQGAVVIVEAPATVVFINANALRLTEGRIAASVPMAAAGFSLHTKAGVVTSTGANAFGALVHADNITDVQSFRGELLLPSFGRATTVTLEAENAARLDVRSGEIRHGRARAGEFVQSMDQIEQDRRSIVSLFESPGSTGPQELDLNDGDGWRGPWELNREHGQARVYTDTRQPLGWDTDRYLSLTLDADADAVRPSRATLMRSYGSFGSVDLAQPHVIRFHFRLDSAFQRSGFHGNKIAIFDGVEGVLGSSGRNTWSIHAWPERTAGHAIPANTWMLYDGDGVIDLEQTDFSRLVSTGVQLVAGDTYEIEITVRPAQSEWDIVILHGDERYSSAESLRRPLRFRSSRNRIYGNLFFNTWIEAGRERTMSIDDVRVEPLPMQEASG